MTLLRGPILALAVIVSLALVVWLSGGPIPCDGVSAAITVGSMPVGEHCGPAQDGAPDDGEDERLLYPPAPSADAERAGNRQQEESP